MNEQMLDIAKIKIDGDTQPRMAIDQNVVAEYADLLESGTTFPPVQVVSDGAVFWLVDGFHRYFAHRKLARKEINAQVVTGLQEEAQWLSLAANKAHGLRRTNNDKAKAVIKALKMKPDMSDNAIAGHVGVSQPTVSKYRASIEEARRVREGKQPAAKGGGNTGMPAHRWPPPPPVATP
jgi:ParB-like chromosome segregation protein Spo0J